MPYLKPALRGNKDNLSPEALAAINALNGPQPIAFLTTLASAWLVIALAIWAVVATQSWMVGVLAIWVIASRQNVLGLLVHDQTHLSLGGRYGDWITNLFCAYPLLVLTLDDYAQVHLTHHRDYFKSNDPDFVRKSGPEWTFPKSKKDFWLLFLKDVLMINTLQLIKGKKISAGVLQFQRRNPTPKWIRPIFLVAVVAALTYTNTWVYFIFLWLVPLLCLLPALVRWGAMCEHEYNHLEGDLLSTTPLIIQTPLERLLIPNLSFGLHPYHHMFPAVSFSRLKKVHGIFQAEGLVNEANVSQGGRAYLSFLLDTSRSARAGEAAEQETASTTGS